MPQLSSSPRTRNGVWLANSFPFYRCNEVVVNYGTAAPEIDLASAREDFFDSFPSTPRQAVSALPGSSARKERLRTVAQGIRSNSQRSVRADLSLDLVIAGPCADQRYQEHLKRMAPSAVQRSPSPECWQASRKWGALSAADAFILPSHQENFGIAVVEALACGTPVLISNKVNIWREIVADECGIRRK